MITKKDLQEVLQVLEETLPAVEYYHEREGCPDLLARLRSLLKQPSTILEPSGDRATEYLPLATDPGTIRSMGYAEGASATFDWYNDHLQILIHDKDDEPAIYVRFDRDGTIAEILFRDGLIRAALRGTASPSTWEIGRDGKD